MNKHTMLIDFRGPFTWNGNGGIFSFEMPFDGYWGFYSTPTISPSDIQIRHSFPDGEITSWNSFHEAFNNTQFRYNYAGLQFVYPRGTIINLRNNSTTNASVYVFMWTDKNRYTPKNIEVFPATLPANGGQMVYQFKQLSSFIINAIETVDNISLTLNFGTHVITSSSPPRANKIIGTTALLYVYPPNTTLTIRNNNTFDVNIRLIVWRWIE